MKKTSPVLIAHEGCLDTWVGYNPQLEDAILPPVDNIAREMERVLEY